MEDLEIAILDRARNYGLDTIERLLFESEVGTTHDMGSRLLDLEYRDDLNLWCICLDFQRLRYGDEGVKKIYRGLRSRCGRQFPFTGPEADYLWDAFVATGTRDLAFLRNFCTFEVQRGAPREHFVVDVVGRVLEGDNPSWAQYAMWKLRGKHLIDRAAILYLFLCACRSNHQSALESFGAIYAALTRTNLYGDVIDHLCREERGEDALHMHKFLISIGDVPQDFKAIAPLIKSIAHRDSGLHDFLRELETAGLSFEAQARKLYELEKIRISGASGASSGQQQKSFLTDEFAARAFATSALSFDTVLSGLRLLNLIAVGPMSIRAIGLSAESPEALSERLEKLHSAGIDTGGSAYARIVKKLASQRHASLLSSVLLTDQHAEVFDDVAVQRQLLVNFYLSRDWPQINRTLAILNIGEIGSKAEERSANILLQTALKVKDRFGVRQILAKMLREHQKVDRESIQAIPDLLSRRAKKFRQNSEGQPEEVCFQIGLWKDVLKSGAYVEPIRWRECILRLGMLGRWDDVERTISWIVSWYTTPQNYISQHLDRNGIIKALDLLFNADQQKVILSWAFTSQTQPDLSANSIDSPHSEFHQNWLRGIRLLRSLQNCGITVLHGTVQEAIIHRLRQLFSVGGVSRRNHNRRLRESNSIPLEHYLTSLYGEMMKPLGPAEKHHMMRNILNGRRVPARHAHSRHFLKAVVMRRQEREAQARKWRERLGRSHTNESDSNTRE